jgi:internalin A
MKAKSTASTREAGMICESNRSPRSWRRFLRFGVRGLIVLVLVIAAGLGWTVHLAHVQRDAVAAIRKAGGAVSYDWEISTGKYWPAGEPWAPKWLVDLVGVDFFGHVTAAFAHHMSAATSDEVIAQVGRLTRVQSLNLHDSAISDSGLVHLKGLTNLSAFLLYRTQVTDAGLVHLKGLTKLSFLHLDGTQFTDAGLVHANGLTNLTELWLGGTQFTDAGLVHVKGLTNLSQLYLRNTRVTDAGVMELTRALPSLRIIR